jgi:hypothetical protein
MAKPLAVYLGIILNGGADGEVLIAAREARRLIAGQGVSANDIAAAAENHRLLGKLQDVIAKARAIKDERDALAAKVERLEREKSTAVALDAPTDWRSTTAPAVVERKHIDWVNTLDLQGRIRLTDWESRFLHDISRRRTLTAKQSDVLQRIVQDAIARTGLAPP